MRGSETAADVLPPDGRLRKPKRPLPPGTVDCHAHIFDRFERYPLSPGRKYSPPLCAREAWLALHAALGVARGVQVHGSPYGFDNSITEDFLREQHGRFFAVASVDPDIPEEKLFMKDDGAGYPDPVLQQKAHKFLKETDWLIITLGSSFSYRLTGLTPNPSPDGEGSVETLII